MMTLTHLQRLEAESMDITREAISEGERPVMLYSIGKDSSVMLHLAKKPFFPAKPPVPPLHVDTTWKFREMIKFRGTMAKQLVVLDPASAFQANFATWGREAATQMQNIASSIRCVHGHFWVGKYARHFPNAKTIAWLRDPARRLISHYFFWRHMPRSAHSLHQELLDRQMTLTQFAALPAMRNVYTNVFLCGYGVDDLEFVGLQEFFGSDLAELCELMGWVACPMPFENKTLADEYAAVQPDPDTLRRHGFVSQRCEATRATQRFVS